MSLILNLLRTRAVWIGIAVVVLGGGLLIVPRIVADRSTPVPTVETTHSSGEQSVLANAPAEIQACFQGRVEAAVFEELLGSARAMSEEEVTILNECFRPASEREDAPQETVATNSSPSSPAASSSPGSSKQTASTTTESSNAPSNPSNSSETTAKSPTDDLHAEVWSKNGYDGASYEYKVNCGPNYATLQECFLWDLTRVAVTTPSGTVYELAKDFNVNSYSGEITRRWVLYGPGGGGLPAAGRYRFTYYKDSTVAHEQDVTYSPQVVDPPTEISYQRNGNDVTISWQAPAGISSAMWYKPSIDPPGNDRQIISKTIAWDQTSATLESPPVSSGEVIEINVAVFFPGGYAYPKPITITW